MNSLIEEQLKFGKLTNGQKKAYFSFEQLYKQSNLNLEPLARTAAAMANAVGGEIFIGIRVEKSRFVDWEQKPELFPSDKVFKSLVQELISPAIQNLEIDYIEEAIHIRIPDSRHKAHMSPNYKYYKRILSKNQVMEEFEIRQLYQSAMQSSLKIFNLSNLQGIPTLSSGQFDEMKFYPRVHVQNEGQKLEKDYKLEVAIPSNLVDENFTVLHKYLKGYDKDKNIYSIPGTDALFQSEARIMVELVLKVNAENYDTFLNSSLNLKLFSTEQVHEQTYKLTDWFHYKGKLPMIESFVKKIEE